MVDPIGCVMVLLGAALAYAGGRCAAPGEVARVKGLQRLALARRLLSRHPYPKPAE